MRFACGALTTSLFLCACMEHSCRVERGEGTPAAEGHIVRFTMTAEPYMQGHLGRAVFIVYRPAGAPYDGQPLRVDRFDAPTFPLVIDLDFAKKDATGAFADIYLRFDEDGDLATRRIRQDLPSHAIRLGPKN